jgi:hypothetical protein
MDKAAQSIGINGTLLCFGAPAHAILVKIYDSAWGNNKEIARNWSTKEGLFYVSGSHTDILVMKPEFEVIHYCASKDGERICFQTSIPSTCFKVYNLYFLGTNVKIGYKIDKYYDVSYLIYNKYCF